MRGSNEVKIDEEFRALIPPLTDGERRQLEENLGRDGCRDPLAVWKERGVLLDGHNRMEICKDKGIEFNFVEVALPDRAAAMVWIISNQFGRRNLTDFQRAELALRLKPLLAEQAKMNQVCQNSDKAPIRTLAELGKTAGVSHDTVHKVEMVLTNAIPEVLAKARAGQISINAAADIARLRPEAQKDIAGREGKQAMLTAAKEFRHLDSKANAEQRAALRNESLKIELPKGTYRTIVIDPPWEMQKIERDCRPNQVGFDYPTMDEDELMAFDVPSLAHDDCFLFLWTTHKHLPLALRLCDRWGFRYSCMLVWRKSGGFQPVGMPQFNCEFVLLCRRGSPEFLDTKAFPCCFDGQRREHSRKPDEFYNLVERVSPGPRIDVFSRERREGFEQWGNEVSKFGGAS